MVSYFRSLFGGESQQKLLFYPNADTNLDDGHEISEAALFRFLLNEEKIQQLKEDQVKTPEMLNALRGIDKLSKITEFETHQSSIDPVKDLGKIFHVFIVFKTTSKKDGDYWWSLEKNVDYIVLQRSRNKNDVKDKCYGIDKRNKVKSIKENLKGKGSIRNLFAILWAHQVITEKYHIKNSNCQSLVTIVSKRITEIGYEYEGYFKFSLRKNDRDTEMLDMINILSDAFEDPHPLLSLIIFENTNLFDTAMESGKYYIDDPIDDGATALQLAIVFSKTKMVEHLLNKCRADPTKSGKMRINALTLAIEFAKENMDIINLLLTHEKVDIDERDEKDGSTALHFAINSCNTLAVKLLIDKGADPNICDKDGRSPLRLAASEGMGTEIIDLILKAKNNKGIDDIDDEHGWTALHTAVITSNELTAEYLIKKGADINYRDKLGNTPLHWAATFANDKRIIDLLLKNIKEEDVDQYNKDDEILTCAKGNKFGLETEIVSRLREKGIIEIKKDPILYARKSDLTSTCNEETGSQNQSINRAKQFENKPEKLQDNWFRNLCDKGMIHPLFQMATCIFEIYLHIYYIIKTSDVEQINVVIVMGLDFSKVTWKGGRNALHLASKYAKTTELIDVILETGKFDINGGDNDGHTPLHYAIIGDNSTENARHLIEKRADPNSAAEDGWTPLHMAAMFAKHMEIVELLLNHKDVDVNYLDNQGRNPLYYAKYNLHDLGETIAKRLKEKGALEKLETQPTNRVEEFNKIKEFLDNWNIDISEPGKAESFLTDDKATCENKIKKMLPRVLGAAIIKSDMEKVRNLIGMGLDIRTVTWKRGMNALHATSKLTKTTELIDVILETGQFDINGKDNNGLTPLHYAIQGDNPTINARHLIEKGADPNIAAEDGSTPLHFVAKFANDMEIVELLLTHKDMDINYLDNQGRNPLYYAKYNLHDLGETIAKRLKEKGAIENLETQQTNRVEEFKKIKEFLDNWDIDISEPRKVERFLTDDDVANEDKIKEMANVLAFATIIVSDVKTFRELIEKGTDISTLRWEGGMNILHSASRYAKTTELIDVILENGKFDINGGDKIGQTPLHYAIKGANPIINARHLIEKGADPAVRDNGGYTPLHLAASFIKEIDILDLLLANENVKIDERDEYGRTALHFAMMKSNVTTVRYLIEKGANPNVAAESGLTPLQMAAIYAKDIEIVELLLNHKDVTVNRLNDNGQFVLLCAKENEHGLAETIANRLKEKGAVEIKIKNKSVERAKKFKKLQEFHDSWDKTVSAAREMKNFLTDDKVANDNQIKNMMPRILFFAIVDSKVGKVRDLIEKGFDFSTVTVLFGEKGMNALHLASRHAMTTELIDVILETGKFDINGGDNKGLTPLHYAIKGENSTINARHLIEKGADPTIANADGASPLHLAANYAETVEMSLIELILETEKVDIDACDKDGSTSHHFEIDKNNGNVVRVLLENGADPIKRDNNGRTPLILAGTTAYATKDMFDLLLVNEYVNIDERDKNGRTALHYAIMISNVTTVRYLIENGANPNVADEQGHSPLHLAAMFAQHMEIVELLLSHKDADVNYLNNKRENALYYTRYNKHGLDERIANRLKEKGAVEIKIKNELIVWDKNILDKTIEMLKNLSGIWSKCCSIDDQTDGEAWEVAFYKIIETRLRIALEEIISDSDVKKLRELIEAVTDIGKAKWEEGMNALHVTSKYAKTTELIDVILETGQFDINGGDTDGHTPLHYAIIGDNPTINARHLIEKGSNPNVADKDGSTPLHTAAKFAKDMDIVELLLNHEGMNVNYLDNSGQNALKLAKNNKHGLGELIANRLKEKGATKTETETFQKNLHGERKGEAGQIKDSSNDSQIKTERDEVDCRPIASEALHEAIINSDLERVRILSKPTWGEKGMNALHMASKYAKTTKLIDVILKTDNWTSMEETTREECHSITQLKESTNQPSNKRTSFD